MENIKMKREISFGKIDLNNTGRKINEITVDLELREIPEGLEFSACGNVYNSERTDIVMGGQCLDYLNEYLKDNEVFGFVYDMWQKYHLNGMHAGTPTQEAALKDAVRRGVLERYGANNYTECCEYLKKLGLYEVEVDGCPYKYGTGWLFEEIPAEDLKRIEYLIKTGNLMQIENEFDYDM